MDKIESFETAIAQLEEIVNTLENSADLKIEDSVGLYARGSELHGYCIRVLDELQKKIELVDSKRAPSAHNDAQDDKENDSDPQ